MIVTSCLRSFLENEIARLCILLADHIGLFPLIGCTVTNTVLHSLIQITIDHRPGNKSAAVKPVRSDCTGAGTACGRNLLSCSPARVFADCCRFSTPEISYFSHQRICSSDNIYSFFRYIITNALAYKPFCVSNDRTEKFTVGFYIFFKNTSVILRNIILLNVVVDVIVSIGNMCNIVFVSDNRIHLCKNLRKFILT